MGYNKEVLQIGRCEYAPAPQCDVHDNTGRHCPEPPVHEVEHQGKRVRLCDGCHSMWLAGAYGRPAHNTKVSDNRECTIEPRRNLVVYFVALDSNRNEVASGGNYFACKVRAEQNGYNVPNAGTERTGEKNQ